MILRDPGGVGLPIELQQVPECKIIKNRLHLDLEPDSNAFESEFERLGGLGSVAIRYVENEDGESHWVMADPEGNEICLLRVNVRASQTDSAMGCIDPQRGWKLV